MSSSVKSFVAGAVTALSVAFLVQQLRNHKTLLYTCRPSTRKIMDSPHLEERMIRKAEAAIRNRTSRLIIIVERCTNDHNYSAILRTAEALGVQHVWIIAPPRVNEKEAQDDHTLISSTGKVVKRVSSKELQSRAMHHLFAQRATEWLTVREFKDTASCLNELTLKGYTIWATDLSQQAVCLTKNEIPCMPEKLAIVFGTEAVGCTQELLEAADLRVYLPLRGFADSLNLSVATALVIQQLFVLDPTMVGSMPEEERRDLRQRWFAKLAMQRFLTSTQKRHKSRLEAKLKYCHELQNRLDQGDETLTIQQQEKLANMSSIQTELQKLDTELQQKAQVAVKDLVDNPPEPLTDMRRADEHRVCFVGRKTKKRYSSSWDSMPATTFYNTANGISSADYFRSRASGINAENK